MPHSYQFSLSSASLIVALHKDINILANPKNLLPPPTNYFSKERKKVLCGQMGIYICLYTFPEACQEWTSRAYQVESERGLC